MNPKHFEAFLAVCKEKSFTKAALTLGCAQSGVTASIKILEETLCMLLFDRSGKNVRLTPEGERLLPLAKQMLALQSQIRSLSSHTGRLSIGMAGPGADLIVTGILKEYLSVFTETEIFLTTAAVSDCRRMLAAGELDAALVLDIPIRHKEMRLVKTRKERILFAASCGHALSGRGRIAPEDFETYAVLLPQKDCIYRMQFMQMLCACGIQPKIALESGCVSALKESSLCGIGIGLLPEFAIQKELIYHMLEKINFPLDFTIETQLFIHAGRQITPVLQNFLEAAKRNLDSF